MPSDSFIFKLDDNDENSDLFIFDQLGNLFGTVEDVSLDWADTYGDTAEGFELFSAYGDYMGWLWKSTALDFVDFNNALHQNTISTGYAVYLPPPDEDLIDPLVLTYLGDTFASPESLAIAEDNLKSVNIRVQNVTGSDGTPAGETIYLQFNLHEGGNIRVGYDITNGLKYTFGAGEWLNQMDEGYVEQRQSIEAVNVTTAVTSIIKDKVADIVAHVTSMGAVELPEDFYEPVSGSDEIVDGGSNDQSNTDSGQNGSGDDYTPPVNPGSEANQYFEGNASAILQAIDAYETAENPIIEAVVDVSEGENFRITATNGDDIYAIDITSNISTLEDDLTNFYNTKKQAGESTTEVLSDDVNFDDVVGNVHHFVTGGLINSERMGSEDTMQYTATFRKNDTTIFTLDVDDIAATMTPPPDSDSETPPPVAYEIDVANSDAVAIYSVDEGFSATVSGLAEVATAMGITDKNSNSSVLDEAAQDFAMEFFESDEYDPFIGGELIP
jgi:hypothetical protein